MLLSLRGRSRESYHAGYLIFLRGVERAHVADTWMPIRRFPTDLRMHLD